MEITAKEIALLLNGSIEGSADAIVKAPSKIEEATAGTISFISSKKYESYAYTTVASVLLVHKDFKPTQPITATLVKVDDVYASLAVLLDHYSGLNRPTAGISEQASIHSTASLGNDISVGTFSIIEEGASIGDRCVIYPQVYVGKGVKIAADVILYPGVKIYHDCEIGAGTILHANVIIGSDGFGFAPQKDGSFKKIPQIGNVILEANVEIGSNTVIDRATMGSTIIRQGAKLDNLIQIAHNVEIGAHTVIAAQAGIAGSTQIGKHCQIGGQAGFVGHIKVADGTKVQAQSGVAAAVKEPGTAIYGSPALAYSNYLRSYACFKNLPELMKKMAQLERKVKKLEEGSE